MEDKAETDSKIHKDGDCSHKKSRHFLIDKENMTNIKVQRYHSENKVVCVYVGVGVYTGIYNLLSATYY